MEGRLTTNTWEVIYNVFPYAEPPLTHKLGTLACIGKSQYFFSFFIIMSFEFTDTPQIEEMMWWNDESIEQFLDEQGDIIGMNIECNELDTNMTV